MGYARHIGRVGALAVTLGVGVAIATTPGIAFAGPSDSSTATGGSSSTTSSSTGTSTTGTSTAGPDSVGADGADGIDGADGTNGSDADNDETDDGDIDEDGEETGQIGDAAQGDGSDELLGDGDENTPPALGDEDAPLADEPDDDSQGSAGNDSATQQVSNRLASKHAVADPDDSSDLDSAIDLGHSSQTDRQQARTFGLSASDDDPASDSFASASADAQTETTPLAAADDASAEPQQRASLVSVVSDLVAAGLNPLLSPIDGLPASFPILTAMLAVMRDELERIFVPRTMNRTSERTVALIENPSTLVDPTTQHVLVIGVDGTNLSRILADAENENFLALLDTSTTAAASIVGHTTISGPSWSAVLTGEWGEKTGVINNVFTPWTYDKFPTVFNQLETMDPDIKTMAIADWVGISAIAGAGSIPVDTNVFVQQIEGDTNWSQTDDAVGDAAVAAISGADAPNFLFTYFAGVDENGHMAGGASPEYAAAIRNVDDNLGEIMDAVAVRESATGEDWTIIVVTDHGHQPQKGFGHGFQSPDETETFVIADGPEFNDGFVNPDYEIVDTTPTVVALFGGTPRAGSDGVPLMTLGEGTDPVDLKQALEDEIAQNQPPDAITNAALSLRTIFATVPYVIFTFKTDAGAAVPSFLVLPVGLLFDGLYVATNIPAQLVALATGVTGADFFHLLPPPPPMFGPSEEAISPDVTTLLCGGAPGSDAGSLCGEGSVAV